MSIEKYNEVYDNLTWYQLNSNFKDPMYQYMTNLERELFNKIKLPLMTSNYTILDNFVIYDRKAIPRFGTYQCSTSSKEAYTDSGFSCFIFQFPYFLENFQLGFIGFVFIIPIMLISIFGGIKESYRWFILNQAIWDLLLCYDYICAQPTSIGWSKTYYLETTCFYTILNNNGTGGFMYIVLSGFQIFIRNASFIPIFHLALSRFLAMYFPRFYKRFTKNGYKILIFILIFNLICIGIFCGASTTATTSSSSLLKDWEEKCGNLCPSKNVLDCFQKIPSYFQCRNQISLKYRITLNEQTKWLKIVKNITYFIPPIMFFLSIICAGFVFFKIASQLKFQLQTNQESFKQTIKISSVVGFQCLTMSAIFLTTGIQKFMQIKQESVDTLTIYDNLPPWLFLLQYYTTTASLNMIRIILDSCIILIVLSGYSKCVVSTMKLFRLCLINPKMAFKKLKSKASGTTVIIISASKP